VWEGEYGGNIMDSGMKVENWIMMNPFYEWERGNKGEWFKGEFN
jgi:hypothetical protein